MNTNIEQNIKQIIEKGHEYKRRWLEQYNINTLLTDWWEALKFYFDRSFNRGRRDSLSQKFKEKAIEALHKFKIWEKLEDLKINGWLDKVNFDNNENPLQIVLREAGVNNRGDRLMVIGTLSFILNLKERNIIKWSVEEIKNGKIKEVYKQLDNIPYIGDKLASFYIRDVVDLYELEPFISSDDFIFTQPIDTWVRQICSKLGIISEKFLTKQNLSKRDLLEIKQAIIRTCEQLKVSPIKFNQGAWYIGFYGIDFTK
jgi:hypothetical protein